MMKELEVLLNKRWIFKVQRQRNVLQNKRCTWRTAEIHYREDGCQIIDNSLLIKMEKIPVIPESFHGHPEIFVKRRVCLSMYPTDVSGRQGCRSSLSCHS